MPGAVSILGIKGPAMKRLIIIAAFLAVTLAGCTTKQYVPSDMQSRIKADMDKDVSTMTGEELRLHFNDLNNFRTAMEMGLRRTQGLERVDYEQNLRWIDPRLQRVEVEMDRRRFHARADQGTTAAVDPATSQEPVH